MAISLGCREPVGPVLRDARPGAARRRSAAGGPRERRAPPTGRPTEGARRDPRRRRARSPRVSDRQGPLRDRRLLINSIRVSPRRRPGSRSWRVPSTTAGSRFGLLASSIVTVDKRSSLTRAGRPGRPLLWSPKGDEIFFADPRNAVGAGDQAVSLSGRVASGLLDPGTQRRLARRPIPGHGRLLEHPDRHSRRWCPGLPEGAQPELARPFGRGRLCRRTAASCSSTKTPDPRRRSGLRRPILRKTDGSDAKELGDGQGARSFARRASGRSWLGPSRRPTSCCCRREWESRDLFPRRLALSCITGPRSFRTAAGS